MFVVDVSNVSHHQRFVKKKSEKSLLFRLCLEFFDLVSPMVVILGIATYVCPLRIVPLDPDKGLCAVISTSMASSIIVSDLHYHTKLGCTGHPVLILFFAS